VTLTTSCLPHGYPVTGCLYQSFTSDMSAGLQGCLKVITHQTGPEAGSQLCSVVIAAVTVRATDVPVGDDQVKHVELTRHLAKSFNHKYGPIFPLPTAVTGSSPLTCYISLHLSQKKGSFLFLLELCQIFTNFNNFW